MIGYFIGFWTTFSFIIVILSIFIWLCIRKSTDNRILEISSIGLEYMINQYLTKCFQKLSYLLIAFNMENSKVSFNQLLKSQSKFINMYNSILRKKLLYFVRGQEIVKNINDNIKKNNYKEIDLFIFPDTILLNINYYKNLLNFASLNLNIEKSDEESKLCIQNILKKSIKNDIYIINGHDIKI